MLHLHTPTLMAYDASACLVPQWWHSSYTCSRCGKIYVNWKVWRWTPHDRYFIFLYVLPCRWLTWRMCNMYNAYRCAREQGKGWGWMLRKYRSLPFYIIRRSGVR